MKGSRKRSTSCGKFTIRGHISVVCWHTHTHTHPNKRPKSTEIYTLKDSTEQENCLFTAIARSGQERRPDVSLAGRERTSGHAVRHYKHLEGVQ